VTKPQPNVSQTVIKTLFALSGNACGFADIDSGRGCEEKLTHPDWKQVKARISHIRAWSPGGPRYDPAMTDEERNDFDNLILLCPTHSTVIDELEPDRYTVEVLLEMKQKALNHAAPLKSWGSEETVDRAAQQLVVVMDRLWSQMAPGLRILSARYGAETTFVDVTGLVAAQVRNDQLQLAVTNDTMGGDPIENVLKQLEIWYRHDGIEESVIVAEGRSVTLP
jgi:hypothetical protein